MRKIKLCYLFLIIMGTMMLSCSKEDELVVSENDTFFYEVSDCVGFDYLFHADKTNIIIKRGEGNNLDYIAFNFDDENEYMIDYDMFNRPQYIKMGDCWIHLCNYRNNYMDALVFKNNEYVTSLENIYMPVDWAAMNFNTIQSRNLDAALESLKEDWNHLWMGIGLGVKVFGNVTAMLVAKNLFVGWLYTPIDMMEDYVETTIELIEDFTGKNFEIEKLALAYYEYSELLADLEKSPFKASLKTLVANYWNSTIDSFYEKHKEDLNKMYNSRFVGPWDYQVDNGSSFEIVFLKNGTLIDYWDFYTYGYYDYDWLTDQLVLTYLYIDNNKGEVIVGDPVKCFDVVFRSNEIQYSLPSGGVVRMVKKNKSQYYTGDYNSDPSIPKL